MNKLALIFIALCLLGGCSRSTETICAETNKLLLSKVGKGFTDAGMLSCLKLSPSEAEASLNAMKAAAGSTKVESKERADLDKEFAEHDPLWFVQTYGEPDFYLWGDGKAKTLASDDGVPFSEVAKKIAFRDRGRVVMRWDRPITKDMFGNPDEFMGIGLESNGVQFTKTSIWFPDYFWEKWSDSISYYWNDFFN